MPAPPMLHHLRFFSADTAPQLRHVPEVTIGEIAQMWNEFAGRQDAAPLGITVTFASLQRSGPGEWQHHNRLMLARRLTSPDEECR